MSGVCSRLSGSIDGGRVSPPARSSMLPADITAESRSEMKKPRARPVTTDATSEPMRAGVVVGSVSRGMVGPTRSANPLAVHMVTIGGMIRRLENGGTTMSHATARANARRKAMSPPAFRDSSTAHPEPRSWGSERKSSSTYPMNCPSIQLPANVITRPTTISFGTKVSVTSWIWVTDWNSDTTRPTTMAEMRIGAATLTVVSIAWDAMCIATWSFIGRVLRSPEARDERAGDEHPPVHQDEEQQLEGQCHQGGREHDDPHRHQGGRHHQIDDEERDEDHEADDERRLQLGEEERRDDGGQRGAHRRRRVLVGGVGGERQLALPGLLQQPGLERDLGPVDGLAGRDVAVQVGLEGHLVHGRERRRHEEQADEQGDAHQHLVGRRALEPEGLAGDPEHDHDPGEPGQQDQDRRGDGQHRQGQDDEDRRGGLRQALAEVDRHLVGGQKHAHTHRGRLRPVVSRCAQTRTVASRSCSMSERREVGALRRAAANPDTSSGGASWSAASAAASASSDRASLRKVIVCPEMPTSTSRGPHWTAAMASPLPSDWRLSTVSWPVADPAAAGRGRRVRPMILAKPQIPPTTTTRANTIWVMTWPTEMSGATPAAPAAWAAAWCTADTGPPVSRARITRSSRGSGRRRGSRRPARRGRRCR